MPDETSTSPADTQTPPSEPVSVPASEPTPPPQESEAVSPIPEPAPTETPAPTEAQASVSEPEPLSPETNPADLNGQASETGTDKSVPEPIPEPAPAQQSSSQPQQSSPAPAVPALRGDIAKARAKIQETKHMKLDKIMAKLTEKGRITNDEVEKLLHVSDATATRYLQALEKENKIKQTGVTGKAVFYERI